MRKARKIMLLVMCAILLICASIAGTVAYLQATTSVVKNTFTVGDIELSLWEYKLDPETGKRTEERLPAGTGVEDIKMIPGRVIEKNPVVTVKADSEACYLRTFIIVRWEAAADDVFSQTAYAGWIKFTNDWTAELLFDGSRGVQGERVGYAVYELRYNSIVPARDQDYDIPVFTSINVPGELTSDQVKALEGVHVEVLAHAVQAEGFTETTVDGQVLSAMESAFKAVDYPVTIQNLLDWKPTNDSNDNE